MNEKYTYTVAETRAHYAHIQGQVKKGIISLTHNKNSQDNSYTINEKILESLLLKVEGETIVEYDESQKTYTVYHSLVPQIMAETDSKENIKEVYLLAIKEFVKDYVENIDTFSVFLDGLQQFIVGLLLLNIENNEKCLEIVNFG